MHCTLVQALPGKHSCASLSCSCLLNETGHAVLHTAQRAARGLGVDLAPLLQVPSCTAMQHVKCGRPCTRSLQGSRQPTLGQPVWCRLQSRCSCCCLAGACLPHAAVAPCSHVQNLACVSWLHRHVGCIGLLTGLTRTCHKRHLLASSADCFFAVQHWCERPETLVTASEGAIAGCLDAMNLPHERRKDLGHGLFTADLLIDGCIVLQDDDSVRFAFNTRRPLGAST